MPHAFRNAASTTGISALRSPRFTVPPSPNREYELALGGEGRRQSLDGSPLTANSRTLNRRPNALFQTTTNAAIAANTTTAVTPKTGLINCKALQAARMRASSGRIPPSVFMSNLPLLWQARLVLARLSRVAAA